MSRRKCIALIAHDEKKDDSGESVCGVAELPAVMPVPQDAGGDANGEA